MGDFCSLQTQISPKDFVIQGQGRELLKQAPLPRVVLVADLLCEFDTRLFINFKVLLSF